MTDQLTAVMTEIELYVAAGGWDQQPRLFALVDTTDLVRREPGIAARLGIDASMPVDAAPGSLTPVEQDGLEDVPLDELLAQIGWPPEVAGCAVVNEVLVLPPGADAEAPDDPEEAAAWVAERPDRREVRLAVGVLRDGTRMAALRLRYDGTTPALDGAADEIVFGPDLAPGLANALLETFTED
ncbi:PPA1309 family protein [Acidothermaceae bacterium B102]|nr:PPA1309 family protein [Acidothermaceae bacterium B102]